MPVQWELARTEAYALMPCSSFAQWQLASLHAACSCLPPVGLITSFLIAAPTWVESEYSWGMLHG